MNISHFVNNWLELSQLAHALKILTELRILLKGLDSLRPLPLRINDHMLAVHPLVNAAGDIARLLAY